MLSNHAHGAASGESEVRRDFAIDLSEQTRDLMALGQRQRIARYNASATERTPPTGWLLPRAPRAVQGLRQELDEKPLRPQTHSMLSSGYPLFKPPPDDFTDATGPVQR